MKYQDYLDSSHWRNLRKAKLDEFRKKNKSIFCEVCGSTASINVHHMKYRNLFDVECYDLRILCKNCHYGLHEYLKQNGIRDYCFAEVQVRLKMKYGIMKIDVEKLRKKKKPGKIRYVLKCGGISSYGLSHKKIHELKSIILASVV